MVKIESLYQSIIFFLTQKPGLSRSVQLAELENQVDKVISEVKYHSICEKI